MPPPRLLAKERSIENRRLRRGDGGGDTASTYATMPPASTQGHGGHKIPTIDGSEGGFLGLVIGLGLLFIGCSFGVWWLLRRRNTEGRRDIPFFSKWSSHIGPPNDNSMPSQGSFGALGRFRHGWTRTNDGDESDDEEYGVTRLSNLAPSTKGKERHAPIEEGEGQYLSGSNPFESRSTTRVQDADRGQYEYADAFASRDSISSLDQEVRATSAHRPSQPHPEFKSPPMSPTFPGGTKFAEQFDTSPSSH